ncbi:sensor domain-containing diguanylate cyclase [Sphingomonas radiodurans]|uniref:sensor domain-containing diguanylate cyclase n=1 Tax=Sphingomonas radiodurans TaxID=2890321 RepID=UPI001E5B236D|nr:sensor domain-containing diguanylate cyclase [Sphingomonas radiodurans]WBH15297.1 diguanylate cyclase [Sphingomonas radiodurans]
MTSDRGGPGMISLIILRLTHRRRYEGEVTVERMVRTCRSLLAIQERIVEARGHVPSILDIVIAEVPLAFPQAAGAVVKLLEGNALKYAAASGPATALLGHSVPLHEGFARACILNCEPFRCDDSEGEPDPHREECRHFGARSIVVVPLLVGDDAQGVVTIYSNDQGAFDDRDLLSACLVASPISYGLSIAAAQEANRRFQATFEQAAVGIAHVSPRGDFLRVNERFCAITGRDAADLLSGGFQRITHPDDLQADLHDVQNLLAGRKQQYSMEKRYLHPKGGVVWINLTVSLVNLPNGEPEFFVAVIEDISERKVAEQLASYDPLTGLPNRRRTEAMLDAALDKSDSDDLPTVIAFLDLDNFKSVNDTLGHSEGDRCLVAVAETLQRQVRRGDVVGRIGGDEFDVILRSSRDDAAALLARLEKQVRKLGVKHDWQIGLSAGAIAVEPGSTLPRERLLHLADLLMYSAKQSWKEARRSEGSVVERVFPIEDAFNILNVEHFGKFLGSAPPALRVV